MKHHILKLLFDYHCQNFHLCKHNGSHIVQPNYFILKPVALVLFYVNGTSERNACYSRDEKGTEPAQYGAILNSMVHSIKSKSTIYYPSCVVLEKQSLL